MPRFCRFRAFSLAFLLLLSACSPTVQPFGAATYEPTIEAGRYLAVDGVVLPLKSWLPKGKPKAVILALHGFNDYSNAFAGAGAYLSKQGIAIYAYDQRGFGASPEPGIWAGDENLMRDAARMLDALKEAYPRTPLYLLGESMGGAVAVSLLSRQEGVVPVDGVVLSGPALWGGGSMSWFYRSTLWLGAHTIPGYEVTGRGLNILASDNIPMLIALGKDPLVIKKTRVDAIYGLVGLMGDAHGRAEKVTLPMLLLYGARDQVIPPWPIMDTGRTLHDAQRIAYYPDGYHMLMRDLQAEVVLRDIASWIAQPTAPLPSGFDRDWLERMKDDGDRTHAPSGGTQKPVAIPAAVE